MGPAFVAGIESIHDAIKIGHGLETVVQASGIENSQGASATWIFKSPVYS